MSRSITLSDLRRAKACAEQVKLFEELFPDGATFSTEDEAVAAALSVAEKFDWDWASYRLLGLSVRGAYEAATYTARGAYSEAQRTAWEAYEAAERTAWETYSEAKRTARGAYSEAAAEAFARAWWNDDDKEG